MPHNNLSISTYFNMSHEKDELQPDQDEEHDLLRGKDKQTEVVLVNRYDIIDIGTQIMNLTATVLPSRNFLKMLQKL